MSQGNAGPIIIGSPEPVVSSMGGNTFLNKKDAVNNP